MIKITAMVRFGGFDGELAKNCLRKQFLNICNFSLLKFDATVLTSLDLFF